MMTRQTNFDWPLAHPSGPDAWVTCAHWPDAQPGQRRALHDKLCRTPGLGVRVAGADWPFHQKSRPDMRAGHPQLLCPLSIYYVRA